MIYTLLLRIVHRIPAFSSRSDPTSISTARLGKDLESVGPASSVDTPSRRIRHLSMSSPMNAYSRSSGTCQVAEREAPLPAFPNGGSQS